MRALLSRFLTDEDGATALEYGLIIALVVSGRAGGHHRLRRRGHGRLQCGHGQAGGGHRGQLTALSPRRRSTP
ncbi:MAG: Flp family type IVb pilin [Brevundimonas sp.]|nr:Flp family type IVb pilin [Brevundimonas sp.]